MDDKELLDEGRFRSAETSAGASTAMAPAPTPVEEDDGFGPEDADEGEEYVCIELVDDSMLDREGRPRRLKHYFRREFGDAVSLSARAQGEAGAGIRDKEKRLQHEKLVTVDEYLKFIHHVEGYKGTRGLVGEQLRVWAEGNLLRGKNAFQTQQYRDRLFRQIFAALMSFFRFVQAREESS